MTRSRSMNATDGLVRAVGRLPGRADPIRIMIVDDSLTVRAILARMIDAEHDLAVVHKTSSAELALAELRRTPVDVVLLDLQMPGMGGMAALPRILASQTDLQVCIVSSLTGDGAEDTLRALAIGAADTMLKPQPGQFDADYRTTLLTKIRTLGQAMLHDPIDDAVATERYAHRPLAHAQMPRGKPRVIAIGASTGGIHATCRFLETLSPTVTLPIVITQHLPSSFMALFARQLQIASSRPTQIAKDGARLQNGHIYVAPGNGHLTLVETGDELAIRLSRKTMLNGCMPSVDPMLASLADATEGQAVGILLSGMGQDGASGAQELADRGGTIMVQDQATAAVWGMPGAVAGRSIACAILPPDRIARTLSDLLGSAS